MTAAEKFRTLLRNDRRFDAEAYNFIYEALDFTLKNVVRKAPDGSQHVKGQELLEGVKRYSIEQFGCLAQMVLEAWGVKNIGDFGRMVFNLVEYDLMGKQDGDRLEDFENLYNFQEAFDVAPLFCYSRDKDQWRVSYVPRSELKPSNRIPTK